MISEREEPTCKWVRKRKNGLKRGKEESLASVVRGVPLMNAIVNKERKSVKGERELVLGVV